jgi:carboxylesterase type B
VEQGVIQGMTLERNVHTHTFTKITGRIWRFGKNKMQMFLGIPYAKPPLGNLRFAVSI